MPSWFARPGRLAAVGVGAVLLLGGTYLAYDLNGARSALEQAEMRATTLQGQIADGDVRGAEATLGDLQQATADARSHSDGPIWKAGGSIPLVGQNFDAVHTISRVLDAIARDGLPPLVDNQVDAETFRPKNGRVELDALEQLTPALSATDRALSAGLRELGDIDAESLAGPLQGPYDRLLTKLTSAQKATSAGVKAATLMPSMMGGDDTRRYVLVVQNNAEIRSTGGLPGAFAFVKAKNGKLTIGRQGSATDFGYFDPPVVKLTKDERNLYSSLMASFWADTTFTPDFPRTAQIMRAMVEQRFTRSVDGVISVDPIALSYILKGTGPVKLRDGETLTSKNAVKLLLSEVYAKYDKQPKVQDSYFADAARRVFKAVAAGTGDPRGVIAGLAEGVDENRILINSTRKMEQNILQSTRVGGALPRTATARPHLGLYLNDSTSTKLEYYLNKQSQVSSIQCSIDGVQTLSTTAILGSDVPTDVKSLPRTILGPGTGERRGSMRMNLRYYAPVGGSVTDLRVNGEPRTIARGRDGNRQVAIVPVLLAPGQKVTVTANVETGKDQRGDVIFSTTPGIDPTPNNVSAPSSCE